jgi:hypothetical protein
MGLADDHERVLDAMKELERDVHRFSCRRRDDPFSTTLGHRVFPYPFFQRSQGGVKPLTPKRPQGFGRPEEEIDL